MTEPKAKSRGFRSDNPEIDALYELRHVVYAEIGSADASVVREWIRKARVLAKRPSRRDIDFAIRRLEAAAIAGASPARSERDLLAYTKRLTTARAEIFRLAGVSPVTAPTREG